MEEEDEIVAEFTPKNPHGGYNIAVRVYRLKGEYEIGFASSQGLPFYNLADFRALCGKSDCWFPKSALTTDFFSVTLKSIANMPKDRIRTNDRCYVMIWDGAYRKAGFDEICSFLQTNGFVRTR